MSELIKNVDIDINEDKVDLLQQEKRDELLEKNSQFDEIRQRWKEMKNRGEGVAWNLKGTSGLELTNKMLNQLEVIKATQAGEIVDGRSWDDLKSRIESASFNQIIGLLTQMRQYDHDNRNPGEFGLEMKVIDDGFGVYKDFFNKFPEVIKRNCEKVGIDVDELNDIQKVYELLNKPIDTVLDGICVYSYAVIADKWNIGDIFMNKLGKEDDLRINLSNYNLESDGGKLNVVNKDGSKTGISELENFSELLGDLVKKEFETTARDFITSQIKK